MNTSTLNERRTSHDLRPSQTAMKLLLALLILVSVNVYAEEECIFDENAYIASITEYAAEHRNSKLGDDGKILSVKRDSEEIVVRGGGCAHLGVMIESKSSQQYTEKQFLQKVLTLSVEFGSWLINTDQLADSIENGSYRLIQGVYFIEVDAMTVFEASHNNRGTINIDFYIN